MRIVELEHEASDGVPLHVYRWQPDHDAVGAVEISHGMAEHAARYARFAEQLCDAGFAVWALDHRGHGKTIRRPEDRGFLAERDGFRRVIEDQHELQRRIAAELPGLPIFLFGHSLGSFFAQGHISLYGAELAGCILSGTAGPGDPLRPIGHWLARLGSFAKGSRSSARLLHTITFGGYNKPFKPARTEFDWLSRDPAEVDKYVADPLCGFVCTDGLYRDLTAGLMWIHAKETLAAIPKDLPIYLFAGDRDPVGAVPGTWHKLVARYRALGIRDVEDKLYAGGRHEMLNETNRDEVVADILAWLKQHLPAR